MRDHINRLLDLGHHTCIGDPLEPLLVTTALLYGRDHKGMSGWPVIVERIRILLADPAHAEWGQDGEGVRALAEMPQETSSLEGLTAVLLSAPSSLPVTVLEWLSHYLLYCARHHTACGGTSSPAGFDCTTPKLPPDVGMSVRRLLVGCPKPSRPRATDEASPTWGRPPGSAQ